MAAFSYLAFAPIDFMVMGWTREYVLTLGLRILVCAVGLSVVLLGREWRYRMIDGTIPTLVEAFALVAFLAITQLVPLPYGVHGMGMMIMLLGVYVFIPNRYVPALWVSTVASVLFIVLFGLQYAAASESLIILSAIILVTNLLGALVAYRLSRMMREEYRDRAVLRESHRKLKAEMEERLRLEEMLRRKAEIDAVTGVADRGAFFERAHTLLRRADVRQEALSLLFIDVDYFRQFTGTYGHLRSDEVLKAVVSVCQSLMGGEQYLARLGGEEFIALLPGSDTQDAVALAEHIRAECQRTPVAMGEVMVHFTVSIGVVRHLPGESVDGILRRLDDAMAVAKYKGRNRVVAGNRAPLESFPVPSAQ